MIFLHNDFDQPIKEFLMCENALRKGITHDEEYTFQMSTHDGIFCAIDLDLINFIILLEQEYNSEVQDHMVSTFNTMQELLNYVKSNSKGETL